MVTVKRPVALLVLVLTLAVGILLGWLIFAPLNGEPSAQQTPAATTAPQDTPSAAPATVSGPPEPEISPDVSGLKAPQQRTVGDVTVDSSSVSYGKADAPVQLTIIGDPQCPHCANAHLGIESDLNGWLADGKVRVKSITVNLLQPANNYSLRSGNLLALVADVDPAHWHAVETAVYKAQPASSQTAGPSDAEMISMARGAGAQIPDDRAANLGQLEYGQWVDAVSTSVAGQGVNSVPSVWVNGENVAYTGPDAIIAAVQAALGS